MHIKKLIIAVLFIFLSFGVLAQHKKNSVSIIPLSPNQEIPLNSVVYFLPKTFITVDVVVEKTVCRAGMFHGYSENLLNMASVVSEDSVSWKITQITIGTLGEADKTKRYAITATGDASAQFVTLTPDGRLLGLNVSDDNDVEFEQPFKLEPELDYADISFADVPFSEKQLKTTSLPAMAVSTAEMIYKLRKRQLKLLGFEYEHHPCDMPTLKFSTDELKSQELQFTELFIGKCQTQSIVKSFKVEPADTKDSTIFLFNFSAKKGFVDQSDMDSEAYSYKCVRVSPIVNYPQQKLSNKTPRGLVYNVPATIDFSIINNERSVAAKQVQIAVSGATADISPKIIIKKGVSVRLNEKTGALKSIQKTEEK